MFNVDWGDEYIPCLLEEVAVADVAATLFLTGRWVEKAPQLAKAIAEGGHEIGNLGGWHGLAGEMRSGEVAQFMQEGEDLILEATGQRS